MKRQSLWMAPIAGAGEFQQYKHGPIYPRTLFAINVENHTKQLIEARRQALRSRKWEDRFNREYNAHAYLQAKRALRFLQLQAT